MINYLIKYGIRDRLKKKGTGYLPKLNEAMGKKRK